MLAPSTTASIKDIGNMLKAGCSARAATLRPGRDSEPVVSEPTPPERSRSTCSEGFSRCELADGSSLFFIVRSFPSRLDFEMRYYDLC